MSPATKEWIKLICQVIGTGSAVTISTYAGGCKLWVAILAGVGTGAQNVWNRLSDSPNDKTKPPTT